MALRRSLLIVVDLRLGMVEGKDWGNKEFLDSLGGSNKDQEESLDQYERFQELRAEFTERQEEMMKNPKVKEFLRAHAKRKRRRLATWRATVSRCQRTICLAAVDP